MSRYFDKDGLELSEAVAFTLPETDYFVDPPPNFVSHLREKKRDTDRLMAHIHELENGISSVDVVDQLQDAHREANDQDPWVDSTLKSAMRARGAISDNVDTAMSAIRAFDSAMQQATSPDAPTVTNEKGGKQSYIPVRFDLIDAKALFATAAVLHEGAEKYGAGNWRDISVRDHLNHMINHAYAYLSGDRSDDHLSHAVCRAMFALGVELDPEATPEQDQT